MPSHVVWYRNDLRLRHHGPLSAATAAAFRNGDPLIPVYILDPRYFADTSFGFERLGRFRRRFLRESLEDLRNQLESCGLPLHIRYGRPEEILPEYCRDGHLYFYQEAAPEESNTQEVVRAAIEGFGGHVTDFPPDTLYRINDLPFSVTDLPEVFSAFRRQVEKKCAIKVTPSVSLTQLSKAGRNPQPNHLPPLINLNQFDCLDCESGTSDPRRILDFSGGETAGRARLHKYFWEHDSLRHYKMTRNGMVRADDSSKLSPWLALGCLSAGGIFEEVLRYETERVRNESTYWLIFELLWRDYFVFITIKHGHAVFQQGGIRGVNLPWSPDRSLFERWQTGTTGYPLVDASMRELAATGWMSNRGRQNVASFLTKNLGIDWRLGAEWFESRLLDYDPCSNYGNWCYIAGTGNDARDFRWFNITRQAREYDPHGKYVRHWLPELKNVTADLIHTPWQMSPTEQQQAYCILDSDYPRPIVDLAESAERQRLAHVKAAARN